MYQDLISHMSKLDYQPKEVPLDGKIHRFDRNGKKKSAWVIGYQNFARKNGDAYVVAKFGDWATGDEEEFKTAMQFSREEKKQIDADIEKANKQIEIERQLKKEETAAYAEKLFSKATDNPSSDYLKRKQIGQLNGAKTIMGNDGRELLIPVRDVDGKLWGCQRILPDGGKYFLEGQQKESCFHVIPFADALLDADVIYIAEGFATASSIFTAIGKPVVVAFDSGNLQSVAVGIKSKYKNSAIIICGDDDRFSTRPDGTLYNAGRESAEKTATMVLGKTVFPKFAKDNGKLTDFNDLFLSEGLDAVKNQIMGIKPEFHSVQCLGYQDNTYYFISSDKPVVTPISSGSFSKLSLLDLMPLSFWQTNYPAKTDVNWDGAINALIRDCQLKGPFIPKNVRGAGVWRDSGRTVVNNGNKLWVDGELKDFREMKSRFIYQAAEKSLIPTPDFTSAAEMNKLASALEMLAWRKPSSPKLMLGFLTVAPICGYLEWRPHVWLTGSSGSGKSFVMNSIIHKIFDKNMLSLIGSTTEAGLRQALKSDARPVVFDELETDDDKSGERVNGIIELCRQASSETNAQVFKGTTHGKSIAFTVRFAAVVSSIRPNLQHEQDKNRFALLELARNEKDNFTGDDGIFNTFNKILTKDFIARMYSRSVNKIALIMENREVLYKVLSARYNGRFADQYGILIAGYFAAMQDAAVSEQEAVWAITSLFDLSKEVRETVTNGKDEENLVNEILESIVKTNDGMFKVSELIGKVLNPPKMQAQIVFGAHDFNDDLERFGLKVTHDKCLAVYPKDREFRKLLYGTKWKFSAAEIVERVKGAELKNLRFSGIQRNCVKLPLPFELIAPEILANP